MRAKKFRIIPRALSKSSPRWASLDSRQALSLRVEKTPERIAPYSSRRRHLPVLRSISLTAGTSAAEDLTMTTRARMLALRGGRKAASLGSASSSCQATHWQSDPERPQHCSSYTIARKLLRVRGNHSPAMCGRHLGRLLHRRLEDPSKERKALEVEKPQLFESFARALIHESLEKLVVHTVLAVG